MIYTVGGIKGGSGKTTVATNLVVLLTEAGRDVLLVDADDQETATDFTEWRNETTNGNTGYTAIQLTGASVRTEVLKLTDKYDDIVIDTGGRDTASQRAALAASGVYLVPFLPRSFDVWTLEKVARLIEEIRPINPKLRAYAFINRADPRGADNRDARELLNGNATLEYLDLLLGNRKAFPNAAAQGLAVTELKPSDPKAVKEIRDLFRRVANVEGQVDSNVKTNVKTKTTKRRVV